jgi:hypothetical protein
MIARVALDPSSLADLQVVGDEEATSALHDLLLTALNLHGAVVPRCASRSKPKTRRLGSAGT